MVMYEEYLNQSGGSVTEAVAGTYKQEEVALPTSKSTNIAYVIHGIEIDHNWSDVVVEGDKIEAHFSRESMATFPGLNNTSVIDMFRIRVSLITSGLVFAEWPKKHWFPKPILVARDKMYVGLQVTGHAGGVTTLTYKIWYTLRKVTAFKMLETLIQ